MFCETTADEITKIIGRAPAKHCSFDPAPTSLVKRLMPLLAGTLAEMVNEHFETCHGSTTTKETVA